MSDEKSQQQTSTESTVAGAAKTGKAISNIAKGAAAGGAHGAAIEARKSSAKWLIPLIAAVLLPLILVAMLPSIIFGSLLGDGTDSPNGISNDEVLVQNMTAINEGISFILSEGLTDVLERIDSDFASSGCDGKEINNPFGADVVFNANAFVSQYCAHKDTDIASISKEDMEALLTANKDKLYSFAFTDEEREIPPEQGDEDSGETFHETIRIYTISYNGEAYFADQVFHLSDDQKLLASQYAQNLTVLLGDGIYQGLSETEFSAMGLSYDGVIFADGETQVVYYNQLDERWKYSPYGMTILSSTPLVRSTVRTGSKSILALRKVNPIMRRNLNMKLKRLLTLCCALSMALGMVTFASAADYSFKTSPDPVYYGSTNYEGLYDAEYRYGSRNQIDYDIPEIQYGLSQEFLESSLNNPYLNGNTQYGFGGSSSNTQYPESDFGSSSFISGGGTIEMPYEPSVTLNDLKQSDGSIGQVSIDRVGLNCKVYEGATDSSMSKGAGHYSSSGLYTGNVGLFGHNRGNHPYFGKLKNVKDGDIVKYKTAIGTKTYKVTFVGAISYTDFSYLNEMGDNRITLITCIANQPSLRLCVQAVEIR